MFNYQTYDRDETGKFRLYNTPNGKYPSITTVLGNTSSSEKLEALAKWSKAIGEEKAKQQTEEAGRRGTAVHLLAERFFKNEPLFQDGDQFEETDVKSFNSIKNLLKLVQKPVGIEVALYSDLLRIAGTCDLIAVINDELVIVDYKTSKQFKTEERIEDYRIQLCGYGVCHNEMFNTDIKTGYIFMASKDGFPQKFKINLPDQLNNLIDKVEQFYHQNPMI